MNKTDGPTKYFINKLTGCAKTILIIRSIIAKEYINVLPFGLYQNQACMALTGHLG